MSPVRRVDTRWVVEKIIPRWEWRTFGTSFGAAESAFGKMTPGGAPVESDELYFIAPDSDIVKVRADLVDIKTLREVDSNGLEQWTPTLKTGFPVAATDLEKVFAALRQKAPRLERDEYTLDQVLSEVVPQSAGVTAVAVHKRRVRYTVDGCMAELSDVEADGHRTRTIAIEGPDPAAVIAAVRSVGLDGYFNTRYPRGLAALLAGTPPRYAVIDVGTNSVKLHVGERGAGGTWNRVVDRAELTRLGEGLQATGEISPEALDRTASAIAEMVDEAQRHGALAVAAVGTAGLRIARNAEAAVAEIRRRAGIGLEVISGEEESRLAYLAATAGVGRASGSVVVFDTGGGSSQFTFGIRDRVEERFSVDVGAARFTERFGLDREVAPEVLSEARAAIAADLGRLDNRTAPEALVGMGGALTNMAAVSHGLATYDPDVVQGTVLAADEIDRQIELYRSRDAEARRSITGLQPKRADVILAGACIVRTVMEKLGAEGLTVSDRGLRHGVLAERFGIEEERQPMPGTTPARPRRAAAPKKARARRSGTTGTRTSAPVAAVADEEAPRLTDADIQQVMTLISGADSVELKLTVPASAQRATIRGLPIDPVEAQPRQVFFFDTPDLTLNRAGVIVRARRIQGGKGDTVVKLRPVVPQELPAKVRSSTMFKTEVDIVPGGFVCSGSFKGKTTGQAVRAAIGGDTPLHKLFSKEQRAFYAEHAPDGVELDSLVTLGPTYVLKGTFTPEELGRRFVVEVWLYPDGSRILELSTKALPSEAFQVAAEARAYLVSRGVSLGGAQEPKTRAALEFFARELQAEGA